MNYFSRLMNLIFLIGFLFLIQSEALPEAGEGGTDRQQAIFVYAEGDYLQAKTLFQNYLKSHPHDSEILGDLGNIFFQEGNLKEAEVCYRKAVEAEPSALLWQLSLGSFLQSMGKHEEASTLFGRVVAQSPGHIAAQRGLRNSLIHLAKFSEASLINEHLIDQLKDSWEEAYIQGQIFLLQGKPLKARHQLERALLLQPELLQAKLDLCSTYIALGEYQKCKPYLSGYEPDQVEDAEFCVLEATYHMKNRNFESAGQWIERALELSPHQNRMTSLKYVNDYQLGRLVIDEVRKRERGVKSSLQEHYQRAATLLEGGNAEQAQRKIRWLMRFYPDDLRLKLMDAVCDEEIGRLDEAIQKLQQITKTKKLDQISVPADAQEVLTEVISQKQFEKQIKEEDWSKAKKFQTKYFNIETNVGSPYQEQMMGRIDKYADKIALFLVPLFPDVMPPISGRIDIRIYADKKSFRDEAYDYYFSDAMFFAGVYTGETRSIYYHMIDELKVSGLVHEISHAVLNEKMANAPLWFDEGLAEYMALKLGGIDFLERKMASKTYFRQLWQFSILPTVDVIVKKRDLSIESYVLWRGLVQFFFEYKKGKYLPWLKKYLDLVSQESFEEDPFREAFADVLKNVEMDWRKYVKNLKI